MQRRIFDVDPLTGITRYFHPSHDGETFSIETIQDVTETIGVNKRVYNGESSKGRRWKGDMHHVAEIPLNIYMELEQQGITQDEKRLRKWLMDNENMAFRVKGGRL